MDSFTLGLLTNDEIIAINQDPLGKPARLIMEKEGVQIWVKHLEDGSVAVGLFNVGNFGQTPQSYFRWGDEGPKSFTFKFAEADLSRKYHLRDVWRQQDLGDFVGSFNANIPYHGVKMIKMFPGMVNNK